MASQADGLVLTSMAKASALGLSWPLAGTRLMKIDVRVGWSTFSQAARQRGCLGAGLLEGSLQFRRP